MNYLGHPHKTAKHITTIPLQVNVEKRHALVVEGSLDQHVTFTSVQDIGGVVARAVEYEGGPFAIEWLKLKDLEAGIVKSDYLIPVNTLHATTEDEMETVNKTATIGMLISTCRGAWDVTDEWNQILPDYEFTQVEDFLAKVWKGE
ncbi:putative -like family protein [Phaeoacremonium minimum UCRPA7]|uniref:Putative-like family protein n=1 Tax=Phaeoacremonium minimum (strain UCR-PA7) TaxID=1286976 RepID=R8BTF1_PHAM7|nr:putative -like family protein [Phaeoacremonium minimum UCRPA7]EOO02584.1 putative -like family protein [Phaeoacremonium minimum UCRPA7]